MKLSLQRSGNKRTAGSGIGPLWKKSPLALLNFPTLFASVMGSTLLLGAAAVSAGLFTSAVGDAALAAGIERVDHYQAGFGVDRADAFRGDGDPVARGTLSFRARDELLQEATAGIEHLGGRVLTMIGEPLLLTTAGGDETGAGRLVSRTDARAHVTLLAGGGEGHGVWVADTTAANLGLAPGDQVVLESGNGGRRISVEVNAVYRNLRKEPASPYWSSLHRVIHPNTPKDPDPPPLVLVEPRVMVRLSQRLGEEGADFRWQFPIDTTAQLTLTEGRRLDRSFGALARRINDESTRLGRLFRCLGCRTYGSSQIQASQLRNLIAEAEDNVAALRGPVELVAVAGILVALVVIGAAGAYGSHRRRSEYRVLFARGMSPGVMALKSVIESLLPSLAGVIAGSITAGLIVNMLWPDGATDESGVEQAVRRALVGLPVALFVIGGVTAMSMTRNSGTPKTGQGRLGGVPWEVAILGGAGIAFVQILRGGALVVDADGVPTSSPFLLLFPVLFIAGLSVFAARAFRRVARLARDRSDGFAIAPYLAVHRLAASPRLARLLLSASALSVGVLVYAHTMSVSLTQTTRAKAYVSVGGDARVLVDAIYEPPRDFPFPTTKVSDFAGNVRLASGEAVQVLAVRATEIDDVAFWDERFGIESLSTLSEVMIQENADELPVVGVGEVPERGALDFQGGQISFQVVDQVDAFPGISKRAGIAVDANELARRAETLGFNPLTGTPVFTDLWIKGGETQVRGALGGLGFEDDEIVSAEAILRTPAFLSTLRTFGFLRVLGATAALLALIGLALYGQARQRGRAITFAIAQRMGLTARTHLLALLGEFGAILTTSGVLGMALGIVTAGLLYSEVDPLPRLSPGPLLQIPGGLWPPLGVALLVTVLVGGLMAQRASGSANLAEELRRGE